MNIAPLTDAEIQASAARAAQSVPLPNAAWAMLLVLPVIFWAARRRIAAY